MIGLCKLPNIIYALLHIPKITRKWPGSVTSVRDILPKALLCLFPFCTFCVYACFFLPCLYLSYLFVHYICHTLFVSLFFFLGITTWSLCWPEEKNRKKIGSQSILGIYSRGRKAVREEVAEIESGHFSDLRRQQTVWIRSNWLIRAARIPR